MAAQKRLNRDELVNTAVAVADAEGLEAVTIRRVAQQHNVTPMALYRHFPDKEGVLDAIAERLLDEVRLPDLPDDQPWYGQIRDLLSAFLDALRPHPNAAMLLYPRMLSSGPGLAITERALALLSDAGMTREDAADTACQALSSLITLAISEPGRTQSSDTEAQDEAIRAKKALLLTLSPRRYPHIVASADALVTCASQDTYYRRGINLIVTGMRGAATTQPFA
jgi:TetR/AcrR family tetracycline transcriptional repressor